MSHMTLEQARAAYALQRADAINTVKEQTDFRRVITKAPVQILTNGLIMTLVFWESKKDTAHRAAEEALSDWILYRLKTGRGTIPPASAGNISSERGKHEAKPVSGSLLRALTAQDGLGIGLVPDPASSEGLRFATQEALVLLNWLKRMVNRSSYAR